MTFCRTPSNLRIDVYGLGKSALVSNWRLKKHCQHDSRGHKRYFCRSFANLLGIANPPNVKLRPRARDYRNLYFMILLAYSMRAVNFSYFCVYSDLRSTYNHAILLPIPILTLGYDGHMPLFLLN